MKTLNDLEEHHKTYPAYKFGTKIGEKVKLTIFFLFKYIIVVGIIKTISNIYLMIGGFAEGFSESPYKIKQKQQPKEKQ